MQNVVFLSDPKSTKVSKFALEIGRNSLEHNNKFFIIFVPYEMLSVTFPNPLRNCYSVYRERCTKICSLSKNRRKIFPPDTLQYVETCSVVNCFSLFFALYMNNFVDAYFLQL